jgi:hypothetical protein
MIDIGEPNLNLPGFCIEKWPDNQERLVYGVLCFVFVYAVPGSVVVLAYSLMGLRLCAISPPFDGPGNEGMASTRQVNNHFSSMLEHYTAEIISVEKFNIKSLCKILNIARNMAFIFGEYV